MYATKNEILEFVDNDGEVMVSFFLPEYRKTFVLQEFRCNFRK